MNNLFSVRNRILIPIAVLVVCGVVVFARVKMSAPSDEAVFNQILKQFAEDDAGGMTPEETLSLFQDALRRGDVDLALRYFLKEVQPKMKKSLAVGKANGTFPILLRILAMPHRESRISETIHEITIDLPGDSVPFGVDLYKDRSTGRWKLDAI